MVAHELPQMSMPDRNAAIAEASERQHQVNLERELYYLGLRKRTGSGLAYYALEDIHDFVHEQLMLRFDDNDSGVQ